MTHPIQHPNEGVVFGTPEGHPVDESRRRLMRAAAASPLLATIPSGSLLAQGSAFNCVVTPSKVDSDAGVITPSTLPSDVNPWARRPAKFRRFISRPGGLGTALVQYPAWSFDTGSQLSDEQRVWYTVGNLTPLSINWDGGCDVLTSICPMNSSPSVDVRVVGVYLPNDDSLPTSVQAQGFYPLAVPQGEGGPAGNIGLVASCWCSLQPNHITVPGPGGDQSPIDKVCNV